MHFSYQKKWRVLIYSKIGFLLATFSDSFYTKVCWRCTEAMGLIDAALWGYSLLLAGGYSLLLAGHDYGAILCYLGGPSLAGLDAALWGYSLLLARLFFG